jgi:hypothetical protein
LALDPAGSFEPFTKRINKTSIGLGRPEVNYGYDRHCRLLLRVCRERPSSG